MLKDVGSKEQKAYQGAVLEILLAILALLTPVLFSFRNTGVNFMHLLL
jgi:hypothetical protein